MVMFLYFLSGRGKIVADFVKNDKPIKTYVEQMKSYAHNCNEFVFVSIEFKYVLISLYF